MQDFAIPTSRSSVADAAPSPVESQRRQCVLAVRDAGTVWAGLEELIDPLHTLVTVNSGAKGLDVARVQQPDVVLLGLLLPDMTGFEWLRRLKIDVRTQHISVIFVTGQAYVGDGVRSLGLGAADYITTPFVPPVFAARIGAHLRLAAFRRGVEDLNQTDALTGLYNRRHFDRVLTQEARRAQRAQTQLSVAMVDVDAFPQYNDHFGRGQGDEALSAIAQVIRTVVRRPADLTSRYFGKTFGILIPETGPANALKVARLLHAAVADLQLPHPASRTAPYLTVSIGVATTEVGEDGEGEGVLQRAGRNLSRAKEEGRNRVVGEGA